MSGRLLLRFEMFGGGVSMKWRPLVNLEHSTLCAQASLDPVTHWFELPESARYAVGRGTALVNGRKVDGFIFRAGADRPVGKITIAHESERFRDDDPRSREDFERLG